MARPKEFLSGLSQAFQDRCRKEGFKVQAKVAKQLQVDFESLLSDDTHSDLTLVVPNDELRLHTCILKHRAMWFYDDYLGGPRAGSSMKLDVFNVGLLKQLVREIYTADNLDLARQLFLQLTTRGSTGLMTSDSGFCENILDGADKNLNSFKTAASILSPLSPDEIDLGGFDPQVTFRGQEVIEQGQEVIACSKFGQDLLDLYRAGLGADVVLVAQEHQFPAHKCVLSARSPYFAAMLGGSWKESNRVEVPLEGVTSSTLEQVLLYMYGGVCAIKPTCNLPSVLAAADIYALPSLTDIVTFILKMEYCHFFHKPCNECLTGMCETLPVALTFNLTDLLDKCLKWSVRHLVRLWPTKQFASLPAEVIERCRASAIEDISTETVIDMMADCDRLNAVIPKIKWAEPVVSLSNDVMEACLRHLSNNLVQVIKSDKFLSYNSTNALGVTFLGDVMSRAILAVPAEKGAQSYMAVYQMTQQSKQEDSPWSEDFKNLLQMMSGKCDQYMNLYINKIVGTKEWEELPDDVKNHIKQGTWFLSVDDSKVKARPPKLSSSKPKSSRAKRPSDIDLEIEKMRKEVKVKQRSRPATVPSLSPSKLKATVLGDGPGGASLKRPQSAVAGTKASNGNVATAKPSISHRHSTLKTSQDIKTATTTKRSTNGSSTSSNKSRDSTTKAPTSKSGPAAASGMKSPKKDAGAAAAKSSAAANPVTAADTGASSFKSPRVATSFAKSPTAPVTKIPKTQLSETPPPKIGLSPLNSGTAKKPEKSSVSVTSPRSALARSSRKNTSPQQKVKDAISKDSKDASQIAQNEQVNADSDVSKDVCDNTSGSTSKENLGKPKRKKSTEVNKHLETMKEHNKMKGKNDGKIHNLNGVAPSGVNGKKFSPIPSKSARLLKKGNLARCKGEMDREFSLKCRNSHGSLIDDDVSLCSHMAIQGSISNLCDMSPASESASDVFVDNSDAASSLNTGSPSSNIVLDLPPPMIFMEKSIVPILTVRFSSPA